MQQSGMEGSHMPALLYSFTCTGVILQLTRSLEYSPVGAGGDMCPFVYVVSFATAAIGVAITMDVHT